MTRTKKIIVIATAISLAIILALVYPFFLIGERVALGFERYVPAYDMVDISEALKKSELSADDYNLLYMQTGLTKIGIDSLLAEDSGIDKILKIQKSFFKDFGIDDDNFAIFSHYYEIKGDYPLVSLQNGDIIVSASTEFSWWTVGHAAMVVDSDKKLIVEINGFGDTSDTTNVSSLKERGNFIVLRPNIPKEDIDKIVQYTLDNLLDLKYDATIGVLSKKYVDNIKYTQCAHIFWYAFYKFGYDIDSNGGSVVTPKNIANSSYFDVVQVSGFDPLTLWS
ncbi:MAG: hypothetical protein J6A54_00380 [Clostridia bacterium]|nr:hypothetical protein [Clostridia bacterium]